ncbi:hypothetical protein PUN28_011605 [Cardiocondyla obscurior]|uniref:Uncharacterized protein n=1 Tax=Cardiocondyla obscurior TaxID=286306 RepID=A0AAW2FGU9_9HYME
MRNQVSIFNKIKQLSREPTGKNIMNYEARVAVGSTWSAAREEKKARKSDRSSLHAQGVTARACSYVQQLYLRFLWISRCLFGALALLYTESNAHVGCARNIATHVAHGHVCSYVTRVRTKMA